MEFVRLTFPSAVELNLREIRVQKNVKQGSGVLCVTFQR